MTAKLRELIDEAKQDRERRRTWLRRPTRLTFNRSAAES